MAVQYSVAQRTSAISTLSTTVGAAGVAKIRTGAQPADCATGDSGTLLVQWAFTATFGTSSSGTLTVTNPVVPGSTATNTGAAGHFRIYTSALVCVMQGNCTATGGGGDWILTNLNISSGQVVTFTSMTVTAANA